MKDSYQAITELLYTYAECIDLGDYEGIARLFAEGSITREGYDEKATGYDAVLHRYTSRTRRHADGTPRTKHVTTNVIVDVDEEAGTAKCRSYFTVFMHLRGEFALQPIISGRYHDTLTRGDAGWRFQNRHIISELIGDLSMHLVGDDRLQ